jgi:glycosyltransferase involved in cell wall biosynthesis
MTDDITVIISAYNEEKNLKEAVADVTSALKKVTRDFKIIIVDDGSTDHTFKVASEIAKKNKSISIIRNKKNIGLGRSFKKAILSVKTAYLTVFPGDNDMSASSLIPLLRKRGKADLITAYMRTDKDRTLTRRICSHSYVALINFLFGLSLRYYNGPFVAKTKKVAAIDISSTGLDVYAETKVRMLKKGYTYKEIPFDHTGRRHGQSTAVTAKSIFQTVRNTISLFLNLASTS